MPCGFACRVVYGLAGLSGGSMPAVPKYRSSHGPNSETQGL